MSNEISNSKERLGRFTSSSIWRLMTTDRSGKNFGTQAFSYIYEKNAERMLGRPLGGSDGGKEAKWGNLCELYVFDNKLSTDYIHVSKVTLVHPEIPYWAGSTDGNTETATYDIKCPFTPKSFFGLVAPLMLGFTGNEAMLAARDGFEYVTNGKTLKFAEHAAAEHYWWQGVSNAIINKKDFFELIVYMPYQSDLMGIRAICDEKWLDYLSDDEIPCLPNEGKFKDLNIIRCHVPQEDKDKLTETVLRAGKLLIDV